MQNMNSILHSISSCIVYFFQPPVAGMKNNLNNSPSVSDSRSAIRFPNPTTVVLSSHTSRNRLSQGNSQRDDCSSGYGSPDSITSEPVQ